MDEQDSQAVPEPYVDDPTPAFWRPFRYFFGPWTRDNAMTWLKLIALVLVIKWLLIDPYRVPTGSMEPILSGQMNFPLDDRVLVNKLSYGIRFPMTNTLLLPTGTPQRWDIAVFRSPEPPPANASPLVKLMHRVWPTVLVKRIVGLPGERIHIEKGVVYADGKPLVPPEGMPRVRYTSLAKGDTFNYLIEKDENGQYTAIPRGNRMRYGIWTEDEYAVVPKGCYLMLGDNSGNSRDGRFFGWVPRQNLIGRAYAVCWPLNRLRDLSGFTRTWWGLALLIGIPLLCMAIEFTLLYVVRSWRLRADVAAHALKRGERVRVNCLAPGLRMPFTRRRLTAGEQPRPGELWLYLGPRDSAHPGEPFLGCVRACDDGYVMEAVEEPKSPDSHLFGPVHQNDLVGRIEAVWWPLWKRRAVQTVPRMNEEDSAKANHGEEN